MANGTCSIQGCTKSMYAKTWCRRHYDKWRYSGDPLFERKSDEDRFWSKVDKSGACWEWTGTCYHDGYGEMKLTVDGKKTSRRAHRMAYEYEVGPIPAGLVVDHMCFNRKCCNPDHLRVASVKENTENRRGAQSNSKSGIRGVCWDSAKRKWMATVRHAGRRVFVGYFRSAAEAEVAVIAKRNELFTHNLIDRRGA